MKQESVNDRSQSTSQNQGQMHDSGHDLNHFLKLALAQVRFKLQSQRPELRVAGIEPLSPAELSHLRLLEELIKEQVPNENSDSATRPAR